jgi:hypothetical protein
MTLRSVLTFLLLAFGFCYASSLPAQNISEQYLLEAANSDRAAHGLAPLRVDAHLVQAARFHAFQMVKHGNISHQFSGEPDLAARAGDAGAHFSLVTENVAEAPNSALIHDLWMKSPGHWANLLDPQVDSVGISVIQQGRQLYAVEDFARTVERVPIENQEAAVGDLISQMGVAVAPTTRDARETCMMKTGYAGSRQPWFVMRYTSADLRRLPQELTARLSSGKYHEAVVGACQTGGKSPFTSYNIAVLLYP